jgi:hypothetical protein
LIQTNRQFRKDDLFGMTQSDCLIPKWLSFWNDLLQMTPPDWPGRA